MAERPAHPSGDPTSQSVATVTPVEAVAQLDDATCAPLVPVRSPKGHKGSFGTLVVIAGSMDYAGAALLVARAAGRAGVGLVRIAVPESLQSIFAGRVLEATTFGLPETDVEGEVHPEEAVERILDVDHDALVIGPGLRPGLATVEFVEQLLEQPSRRRWSTPKRSTRSLRGRTGGCAWGVRAC
jgi:NAD(P)H-hydrate repair Nnr-like enzyme with NAD(P)H-hydrate dehydratase domain